VAGAADLYCQFDPMVVSLFTVSYETARTSSAIHPIAHGMVARILLYNHQLPLFNPRCSIGICIYTST